MRHCEIGKEAGTYVRVSGTSRSADKAEELCAVIKRYMVEAARTKSDKEKVKDVTVQNLVNWGVLKNIGGALMPTNVFVLLTNNAFPICAYCLIFFYFPITTSCGTYTLQYPLLTQLFNAFFNSTWCNTQFLCHYRLRHLSLLQD